MKKEIHIVYSQRKFNNILQATGRSSVVIDSIAPKRIERFKFSSLNGPNLMSTVSIPRDEFIRSLDDKDFQSLKYVSRIEKEDINFSEMEYVPNAPFPVVNYEISPEIRSHIGGPDAFYFGQAWIRGDFNVTFSRKISINGILSANLFDNFDNLRLPSDSILPKVRTEIVDYLKDGSDLSISRLQFNYLDTSHAIFTQDFHLDILKRCMVDLHLKLFIDHLRHHLQLALRFMMQEKETLIRSLVSKIMM